MEKLLSPPYSPLCFGDQIHCGTGRIAIVTGWYVSNLVEKRLDKSVYAAIGNIYNWRNGIEPFVRNLLANPQVDTVLCLSATTMDLRQKPSLVLADFLRDKSPMIAGADRGGNSYWSSAHEPWITIGSDIPLSSIARLKERIQVLTFEGGGEDSVNDLIAYCNNAASFEAQGELDKPELYPMPETRTETLPGPAYGVSVSGKTIWQTWLKIIHLIHKTGEIISTGNGQPWQEIVSLTATVTDEPEDLCFPEGDWFPCDREFLYGKEGAGGYVRQIVNDAPYEKGTKYTYGQRLRSWFGRDQVEDAISKLVKERDAASAVMSLWDPGSGANCRPGREADTSDHTYGKSPCLNHVWVRIRANGMLVMTALFRSNDMYSAWPSNAMGLRCLQKHIFDRLAEEGVTDLSMGPLITTSLSAHIYETSWGEAAELVDRYYKEESRQDYLDPVGNFTVHRDESRGGVIVVRRLEPGMEGQQVDFYESKNPLKLIREIASKAQGIQPAHMGYLGLEIARAFSDPNYVQDQAWWKSL